MKNLLVAFDAALVAVGGAMLALAAIFLVVIFGTLFGAVCGTIVGWAFGSTILDVLAQFGVHNITMWQFGAFLGFVGGFLKTKVTASVTQKK